MRSVLLAVLFVLGTGTGARAEKAKKVDWSQYLESPGERSKLSRAEPAKASKKAPRAESRAKAKPAKRRRR